MLDPETELDRLQAEIGQALKEAREASGQGQNEVAKAAGVGGGYVSRLERGQRLPGLQTAMVLADVTGADADYVRALVLAARMVRVIADTGAEVSKSDLRAALERIEPSPPLPATGTEDSSSK